MKLKNFLFGNRRYGNTCQVMNVTKENGEGSLPCNPPPRNRPNRPGSDSGGRYGNGSIVRNGAVMENGELCNPYGKLLPDAEKYTKHIYDHGNDPYVFSIPESVRWSNDYRRALWSGEHMQLLSMTIPQGEEIGIESHDGADQLVIVWEGSGEVMLGRSPNRMSCAEKLSAGSAVLIPAGCYHNIRNTSRLPMRLITVYSPMQEPYGTVQKNKPD